MESTKNENRFADDIQHTNTHTIQDECEKMILLAFHPINPVSNKNRRIIADIPIHTAFIFYSVFMQHKYLYLVIPTRNKRVLRSEKLWLLSHTVLCCFAHAYFPSCLSMIGFSVSWSRCRNCFPFHSCAKWKWE